MSTKTKFLEIVESYYKVYKSYEEAYSNLGDKRENLLEKLKPLLSNKNSKDKDFKKVAIDYLSLISAYPIEVSNVATKFLNAANLYILVTEEDLSEEMAQDFVKLKNIEYKSAFSIKGGQFVRNSSVELPKIPEAEYDNIFKFLTIELGI